MRWPAFCRLGVRRMSTAHRESPRASSILVRSVSTSPDSQGSPGLFRPWDAGGTPLLIAARWGHDEVVQQLLAAGADAGATDKNGVSPLSAALAVGHEAAARRLFHAMPPEMLVELAAVMTPKSKAAAASFSAGEQLAGEDTADEVDTGPRQGGGDRPGDRGPKWRGDGPPNAVPKSDGHYEFPARQWRPAGGPGWQAPRRRPATAPAARSPYTKPGRRPMSATGTPRAATAAAAVGAARSSGRPAQCAKSARQASAARTARPRLTERLRRRPRSQEFQASARAFDPRSLREPPPKPEAGRVTHDRATGVRLPKGRSVAPSLTTAPAVSFLARVAI